MSTIHRPATIIAYSPVAWLSAVPTPPPNRFGDRQSSLYMSISIWKADAGQVAKRNI